MLYSALVNIERKICMGVPCIGLTLCLAAGAQAGNLTVAYDGCESPLHLRADAVELSVVMQSLADELGFELAFDPQQERVISVDLHLPPAALIGRLTRKDNVTITAIEDASCQEGRRVAAVRFAAAGEFVDRPAAVPAPVVISKQRSSNAGNSVAAGAPRYWQRSKPRREMSPEERYNDRVAGPRAKRPIEPEEPEDD